MYFLGLGPDESGGAFYGRHAHSPGLARTPLAEATVRNANRATGRREPLSGPIRRSVTGAIGWGAVMLLVGFSMVFGVIDARASVVAQLGVMYFAIGAVYSWLYWTGRMKPVSWLRGLVIALVRFAITALVVVDRLR
jgi:hypothetical protein